MPTSVVDYLSELGIEARVGDAHATCKCNKNTLWVPNEHFALCMSCHWRPSPSLDYSRGWLVEYLGEVYESCRSTLLSKADERHAAFFAYFKGRGIVRSVVLANDIGMMSEYDLTESYEKALRQIDHAAELAKAREKQQGKGKKKLEIEPYDRNAEVAKLDEFHESLEKCQDTFRGAIVFFGANAQGRFIRMRFRKPFEDHRYAFGSTKNICGSGVFGAYRSYPLEKYEHGIPESLLPLQGTLLVCEGEFNLLMLQQKLRDISMAKWDCVPPEVQHWVWTCALGSSSDADCKTVASMAKYYKEANVTLCYDWDDVGMAVCEKLRAAVPCKAFAVPGEPKEKNGKLYKTMDLCDWLASMKDPAEAVSALAALAAESKWVGKSDSTIRDEIRALRKEKDQDELDRRNNIKKYLWELLNEQGGVFTDGDYAYAYNSATFETWRIDEGPKSKYVFSEVYGIPSGDFQNAIMKDVGLKILYEGKRVKLYPWAYYDRENFTAYINLSQGHVAKITPDKLVVTKNGKEGVLFYDPRDAEAIPLEVVNEVPNVGHLACGFEIDEGPLSTGLRGVYAGNGKVTQRGYEMLFMAKYLSLFLPQLFTRKNIVYTSGPTGGGKTFANSKPGQLLRGSLFSPSVLLDSKKDQLETVLTNERFVLIDNFDAGSKPNQALLCQACTTGTVMMRALYETNKLAKYPIIAEIYMTGLAIPASFRGDLNNRVLEFPFLRYEQDGKAETQRHEEFLAMRVPLLSETIARLQLILKGEREEAKLGKVYKTNFRVKDFGLFLKRQAHFGGFEDEMESILDEVVQTQEQRTSEKSTVFPTLTLLVGRYHSVYGHERMNSTRLCAVLTDMAKHLKTKFFYEDNPIGLGMFISENVELLEKKYGLVRREYGGHMSFRFELTDHQIAARRADLEVFGVSADTLTVY